MIYFDNAATTYPKPQCVYDAVEDSIKMYSFNAGRGSYRFSKDVYQMIENTREKLSNLVGVNSNQIAFTSSATESLNLLINGLSLSKNDCVFVSPFEHNAIIRVLYNLNADIKIIPFNEKTWELEENKLHDMLIVHKPKLVVISHISNVTGYELPYQKIFKMCKQYGSYTILDSAQGFGTDKVDMQNVDYLVFAGHKSLYSAFGVAGFIINTDKILLKSYKTGGTGSDSLNPEMPKEIPYRYEAGSMNSSAIYLLNKSIDYIKNTKISSIKNELTVYFLSQLHQINNVEVYCPEGIVPKGIVSFNIKGYTSDEIGSILANQFDICVRTGYHCSPYIHDFIGDKKYAGCVRVSFGPFNTKNEIDILINAIKEITNE